MKRLFGRRAQRIGCEILIDGSDPSPSYRMTVRVSKPPWAFTIQGNASIDVVIRSSAEPLTGVMRPCAFAADEGEFDRAIAEYRKPLDLFLNDDNTEKNLDAANRKERPTLPPAAGSPPQR